MKSKQYQTPATHSVQLLGSAYLLDNVSGGQLSGIRTVEDTTTPILPR